eukprot:TRINITY_DN29484_c0_g1_i1.p1 TRINITY_DN29484_c0_g1~~TRINITY_DN29484_c0_g1_i1.p1  ORF type:complete len:919 (+),score=100.28 TRINITY_DN29484_c0_g1_i1:446-3202(+)
MEVSTRQLQMRNVFDDLDISSTQHVFSFLEAEHLCTTASVCREWRSISDEDSLWQPLLHFNPRPMVSPSLLHSQALHTPLRTKEQPVPQYKRAYGVSESWRKGLATATRMSLPGTASQPAIRISPDGSRVILVSGGLGLVHVYGMDSGEVASYDCQPMRRSSEQIHYSCAAISGDCCTVGFGDSDGLVRLFDVTAGGRMRATAGGNAGLWGAAETAGVQSLALSWNGSHVAAGLTDGHLALADCPYPHVTSSNPGSFSPVKSAENSPFEAHQWNQFNKGKDISLDNESTWRQLAASDSMPRLADCIYDTRTVGSIDGVAVEGQVSHSDWKLLTSLGRKVGITCLEPSQYQQQQHYPTQRHHGLSSYAAPPTARDNPATSPFSSSLEYSGSTGNSAAHMVNPSASCLYSSRQWGPLSSPHSLIAGTSGGHVIVLDGETGEQKVSLVGSCNCPVSCLCLSLGPSSSPSSAFISGTSSLLFLPSPYSASSTSALGNNSSVSSSPWPFANEQFHAADSVPTTAGGMLVYGAFQHGILGHGHHNSVYVWDVVSASRIALLYPGGKTLRYTGRGGKGGLGGVYQGHPVKAVHADEYKVALTSGRTISVFDTRTWEVMHEITLSHAVNNTERRLTQSGSGETPGKSDSTESIETSERGEGRRGVVPEGGEMDFLNGSKKDRQGVEVKTDTAGTLEGGNVLESKSGILVGPQIGARGGRFGQSWVVTKDEDSLSSPVAKRAAPTPPSPTETSATIGSTSLSSSAAPTNVLTPAIIPITPSTEVRRSPPISRFLASSSPPASPHSAAGPYRDPSSMGPSSPPLAQLATQTSTLAVDEPSPFALHFAGGLMAVPLIGSALGLVKYGSPSSCGHASSYRVSRTEATGNETAPSIDKGKKAYDEANVERSFVKVNYPSIGVKFPSGVRES